MSALVLLKIEKFHCACFSVGSGEYDTIPSSVTSIENNAFRGCTSLTSITIPSSVTSIGMGAFYNCDNVTIYGYANSTAQTYASENDIPFVVLTGSETTTTPAETTKTAPLSDTKLMVNGVSVATQAYMIDDSNYIKLRDLATMITGTGKNFEVT